MTQSDFRIEILKFEISKGNARKNLTERTEMAKRLGKNIIPQKREEHAFNRREQRKRRGSKGKTLKRKIMGPRKGGN